MRRVAAVLLFLLAPLASAGAPRLVFQRVLPPSQEAARGAEELAVVRATGDPALVDLFVDLLLEQVGQSRLLRGRDARRSQGGNALRIGIENLTCTAAEMRGEGSTRDARGERVRRTLQWIDARCMAAITILARDGKPLASFPVRGEGTSPRSDGPLALDERQTAGRQALRYAAVAAAEQLTPRSVRESIELDESAPAFEPGMAFVRTGQLREARQAWERALGANARSAALHFNVAAVCEALGDRAAAAKHLAAARALAPENSRYEQELRLFEARGTKPRR